MKKIIHAILIVFMAVSFAHAGSQQASSTLASAIIVNARAYLNEATATFWTDVEMLQWLNDGLVDLVGRSHCLEDTEDINLVANQVEYSITSTYLVVKAVRYVDSNDIERGLKTGKPAEVGWIENVQVPVHWYDWAGEIGVYPTLSSVTSEKVTLYLVTRPTAIASGVAVPTPAIYDKALTLYIVAQAWAKDRQMSKYGQAIGRYHAELDRYRQDLLVTTEKPKQ
ncbi:MAG: hypothetical protein JRI53_01510 [Deltaproteobacteria bacterium]|nr:hypothetical protein [Deltaproteobacteria bacterium]MBW2178768.1 hypothetical protein [Deltaproteobacteria bacterium]MBW2363479.1 hypothetical protein [Deltaproteobacteria bacterium]